MQEADKQFHWAVACPAAKAGHGGIEHIGAKHNGFDSVCKSQLQVVVSVDADLFAGFFSKIEVVANPPRLDQKVSYHLREYPALFGR